MICQKFWFNSFPSNIVRDSFIEHVQGSISR